MAISTGAPISGTSPSRGPTHLQSSTALEWSHLRCAAVTATASVKIRQPATAARATLLSSKVGAGVFLESASGLSCFLAWRGVNEVRVRQSRDCLNCFGVGPLNMRRDARGVVRNRCRRLRLRRVVRAGWAVVWNHFARILLGSLADGRVPRGGPSVPLFAHCRCSLQARASASFASASSASRQSPAWTRRRAAVSGSRPMATALASSLAVICGVVLVCIFRDLQSVDVAVSKIIMVRSKVDSRTVESCGRAWCYECRLRACGTCLADRARAVTRRRCRRFLCVERPSPAWTSSTRLTPVLKWCRRVPARRVAETRSCPASRESRVREGLQVSRNLGAWAYTQLARMQ